jgi:predicted CXXCH cytochrome family protein
MPIIGTRILRDAGVASLLTILLTASCSRRPPEPRAAARYVKPGLCAGCHPSQWDTFRHTGMSRSFYRATPANMRGLDRAASFYHRASDRYYQMLRRGDTYFCRRFQKGPDGSELNVVEVPIDYVMGSGNHARSYLHRTEQNRLVQLPVTWYAGALHPTKPGVWAMSPGYDRPDHLDFRRKIGYDCFFCHNAYPELPPGGDTPEADPVYPAQLPEGIDCQRCHGPGSAHLEAAQQHRPAAEIRQAIVNPAGLSSGGQMEVCMQCHLETTSFVLPASIQRYGRGAFSYVPGQPLADFLVHFDHAKGTGHDDKFEIVSAAYRLRQSKCFESSGGALVCTVCHNPHRTPSDEAAAARYRAACGSCHQSKLESLIASGRHPDQPNCVACHMGRRRTDDVVHAVITDHRILRRQADRDLLAPLAEHHDIEGVSYRGEVVLYYPQSLPISAERDLYLAVAQVAQKSNLEAGIPQLEAALRTYRPQRPEFYAVMAQALLAAGRRDQAISMYRTALEQDPRFLPALRALGAGLSKAGDTNRAVATLEQARALDPRDAATLHELGLAYHQLGRDSEALSVLRDAIRLDPDLPEIRNSLANILFEMGDRDKAGESLREAIRLQPDFAAAHADLGNVLAAGGDLAQAQREYRTAVQLDPSNQAARYGYGASLASQGHYGEAEKQLEEAVRLSPDFAEALAILGDLYARRGQLQQAMARYREALRSKPRFGRAHLGLGATLAANHDVTGAREHLTVAAQDPNPEVRQEAQELLRQLAR